MSTEKPIIIPPRPGEKKEKENAVSILEQSHKDVELAQHASSLPDDMGGDETDAQKEAMDLTTRLADQYEIQISQRLAKYDNGPSKAYRVIDRHDSELKLFALCCEEHIFPRTHSVARFAARVNAALVQLVAAGVVYWPPAKAQRYVLIYRDTLGEPIMRDSRLPGLGWKPEFVRTAVIEPLLQVLRDFHDADIVHGAIRPTNMFNGGSAKAESVILGECLSTPPSYAQPVLFEPIDRALASPGSRGLGTTEDDIYALGVSIALMLRTTDPLEGMTDQEIIRLKIEHGTFNALLSKERITGPILELLRGLLCDERAQRWGVEEVAAWIDGRRLSPKQNIRRLKANRHINFNGEKYFMPKMLAMDLHKNPAEAIQLMENDEIYQWLKRSVSDNHTVERYESAMHTLKDSGRGPAYWDYITAILSIALDPEAPINYKGFRFRPEGIPYMLAEAISRKNDIQPLAEILSLNILTFWISCQTGAGVDYTHFTARFDSCRNFLRQKNAGFGIERCLYYLNPEAPCLSPRLKGFYIRNPDDLVYSLEKIAKRKDRPAFMLDRHVIAFLSTRERRAVDQFMPELNAFEEYKRVIGNLHAMSSLQKRMGISALPNLTDWCISMVEPLYERYHDRELRKELQKKVEGLRSSSNITRIVELIDNQETVKKDMLGFKKAMSDYRQLRTELQKLQDRLENPEKMGQTTGREIAAVVSGIVSGIVIIIFAVLHFSQSAATF